MIIKFSKITGFIRKEFLQMMRDVRMRMVLFAAPVIMLLLFGYAVSTDVKSINMAYIDEDKTELSRELIGKFTSSGYFINYAGIKSPLEAGLQMDSGKIEVFLHIENGFEKKIRSGSVASVQLLIDGTDSSRASVIVSYVNTITQAFSYNFFRQRVMLSLSAINSGRQKGGKAVKMPQDVELKQRVFFNPDLSSTNYFLPVIQGLIICLLTIMLTSMSIVKERETGTIDQIAVSPITPWELIAGKTIPFALVSFIDIILITALIVFWFKVPFKGNILFLMISAAVFIISTTSVGLFISTISKTQQQAILTMFFFLLPSIMFSGFIFPVSSMPPAAQVIAFVNPVKYYVDIIRGIFLKGVGFDVLWPNLTALAVIGSVLFYVSARRFGKSLE